VHLDESLELALLKAESPLPAAVLLGDADALANGAPLISISAPMNLEFSVVPGTVASVHRLLNGVPVIQANLPATHGSSGGPVFDRDGRLIGLISGELGEAQFTIVNKINNAYPLLRAAGILPETDSEGDEELAPAAGISSRELRAVVSYNRGVRASLPADKLAAYGTAVALLPDFYEAWFNLALARVASGDTAGAEAAYRKAAALRPEAPEVARNLGRLLRDLGRLDEAKAVFAAAAERAPDSAQAQNDLGETCRQLRQYDEAMRHFEDALRLAPDYAAAHFNLGITCAALGDAARAAQHLERYLFLKPQAADAGEVRAALAELRANQGGATR
jgi:tetratricopeptide (TPR) repeat protein